MKIWTLQQTTILNQWTQRWETQSYQMALFCNSFHLKICFTTSYKQWWVSLNEVELSNWKDSADIVSRLLSSFCDFYFYGDKNNTSWKLTRGHLTFQLYVFNYSEDHYFAPLCLVIWFNILQNIYKIFRNISLLWHNIFTGVPFRWGRTLQLWNQEKRLTGKNFYFDEQKFQPFSEAFSKDAIN